MTDTVAENRHFNALRVIVDNEFFGVRPRADSLIVGIEGANTPIISTGIRSAVFIVAAGNVVADHAPHAVRAGIRVILTGHFHTSDIAKDWDTDSKQAIFDVTTGSTVSYPCDYREISLDVESATLSITTKHVSSLIQIEKFEEQAKSRLYKSIYDKAYDKASGILHDKQKCTKLAEIAAKTFILHAEGNEGHKEHASSVANIRQSIKTFQQQNKNNLIVNMALSGL